jgi:hypothetical protein
LEHGTRDEVLRDAGLDRAGVIAAIAARLTSRSALAPQARHATRSDSRLRLAAAE